LASVKINADWYYADLDLPGARPEDQAELFCPWHGGC